MTKKFAPLTELYKSSFGHRFLFVRALFWVLALQLVAILLGDFGHLDHDVVEYLKTAIQQLWIAVGMFGAAAALYSIYRSIWHPDDAVYTES